MSGKSTRIAIVERSLLDILERLADLPDDEPVRVLRQRALVYERRVRAWDTTPPTADERAAMLNLVLELNAEVMQCGRASKPRT